MRRTPIRRVSKKRQAYAPVRALWGRVIRQGGRCIIPGCPHPPQACHYWPEGKYKRVRVDLDNGFPACFYHHIEGWHKDPDVQQQIKDILLEQRGQRWYDRLKMRRDAATRPDLAAIKVAL